MPKFKNVKVKKRGGGFRMQRAQVLASGKLEFVKNISKRSSSSTKKKSTSKRKRSSVRKVIKRVTTSRPMARRRRSTRRTSSRKSGIVSPKIKSSLKQVMIGLGAASTIGLIGSVIGQPALGQNKLVNAGASFVIGGPIAAATSFLLSGGGMQGGQSNGGGMI
jgi:hypothetical protein